MSALAPLALGLGLLLGSRPGIDSDDLADLPLEQLGRIRVRAVSLVDERTDDAPGLVTIVTRRELELFGARDLATALDRATGVGRVTNFYQREMISVRADLLNVASSHVLVLLDGRPMRETRFGGANADLFREFPLQVLDHIEVIRGPGSVLHGSGAYSGVINLVTRRPERAESAFGVAGGAFRTLDSWVTAAAPYRDGDVRFGARVHNSNGWPQTYTDPALRRRAVTLDEAGGSIIAGARWRDLSAQVLFIADRAELFAPAPTFPADMRDFTRYFADVGYEHRLTDALAAESHVTFTRVNSPGYGYSGNPPIRTDVLPGKTDDGVFEQTITFTPSPSWDVVAGGLLNWLSNETATSFPAESKTWWSAFASLRSRPAPGLSLIAGGQVIRAEGPEITAVPRLGAVWSHASGWGAKALYGGAYRSPAGLETSFNLPNFLVGNPDLEAETVRTFDFEIFGARPGYRLSLAFYESRQEGLIFPDPRTLPGTFRNSGQFAAHGVEVEARLAPSNLWYVTASIAVQASTFNDSLDDVTPIPNGIVRLGVGLTPSNGVSLGVHDTWYGRPADVASVNPGRRLVNPVPTATHWLEATLRAPLDHLTGAPLARGVSVFVRGENLLDAQVWQPEFTQRSINSIPARSGSAVFGGFSLALAPR